MLLSTQNNNIVNPTSNIATKFYFDSKLHVHKKTKWNKSMDGFITIEDCRDYLKDLKAKQDPIDLQYSYDNTITLFMENGVPHCQFIRRDGTRSTPTRFTKNGWRTFANDLLPKNGRVLIEQLAQLDEQGSKLATATWNKFGFNKSALKGFRTINVELENGTVGRAIRHVHSASVNGYTAVDNYELMESLLDDETFNGTHVLDFLVTDDRMRVRFALCPVSEMTMDGNVYPMMELRNSEIGKSSINIGAGVLRPTCDNGLFSTENGATARWAHRGDPLRISRSISASKESLLATAMGTKEIYSKALNTMIDNIKVDEWLEDMLKDKISSSDLDTIIDVGLKHSTTTESNTVARVVDAMTYGAQMLTYDKQQEIEHLAFDIMRKGVREFA